MATSDTVVGIIGAVILTGAMVAVFYYENQAGDPGAGAAVGEGAEAFTFTHEQTTTTLIDAEGQASLGEGTSRSHDFQVPAWAYNVTATITWTDDDQPANTALGTLVSGPDEFKITLISPSGVRYDPQMDTSGSLTSFHFHAIAADVTPPSMTVAARGDDEADALANLEASTADAHGVGSWTVEVNMTNTNDDTGRPAGQDPPVGQDAGNPYALTVKIEHWKPVAQTTTA